MQNSKDLRLAVLIDADNVPYSNIKGIMEEIAKYGNPTTKRIYADWTKPTVSGWKNVLLENAITPIQQYSYSTGKNATDSAMIIDAMDILYSGKVDGFCIVSSDSDFTRLATRLREAGMLVIGIGEKKTLNPFIVACDRFIYLEILGDNDKEKEPEESAKPEVNPTKKTTRRKAKPKEPKVGRAVVKLISTSINDLADETGWAYLADVGSLIMKKQPDFDPRNFGFQKLTPLIRSINLIEIDERDTANKGIKHIYIRNKTQ
ncbi:NYN domain-containing protein [Pedobacter sp. SYSU D00535]|uniref:NYN domain-containing protein n=1 Tax=Pedobacter sp. SYSU D00535 TaxID=2810308 RepID=UPI001A9643A1|nr:NYN domain-containing protein [Pedobacter sp. SYSU D00535]